MSPLLRCLGRGLVLAVGGNAAPGGAVAGLPASTFGGVPDDVAHRAGGSLPRPAHPQRAWAEFEAGRIDRATLARAQAEACRDRIARMEATGSPIVSDGERRASSFATRPRARHRWRASR